MTDSSDNSFNTNSYRKKVSLDDIDGFLYDIHRDTDDIIRDFHKNKKLAELFFSGIIVGYEDQQETMLLLIYLVLCMKTKLNNFDEQLNKKLRKLGQQTGGELNKQELEIITKELPLAFNSIYYQYAMYKLKMLKIRFENQSVIYLDQIVKSEILYDHSSDLVLYDEHNYFNGYCSLYRSIMKYMNDSISIMNKMFENDNLSEVKRYYVYRRIIQIDVQEKKYTDKNDTLRYFILQNKSGLDILDMLYGTVIFDRAVNNIVDGMRTKVTPESKVFQLLTNTLLLVKNKLTPEQLSYQNNTLYKLSTKVTNLLEHKQNAGFFIDKPGLQEDTAYAVINKIIYVCIRYADSIHDFMKGGRTTSDFKNKNFVKHIKFISDKYFKTAKEKENEFELSFLELLQDIVLPDTEFLGFKFSFDDKDDDKGKLITLQPLINILQDIPSSFEEKVMEELNRILYKIGNYNGEVKNKLLHIYRPGNKFLEKMLVSSDIVLNKARYVNKEKLSEQETIGFLDTAVNDSFSDVKSENSNLLAVIYEDKLFEEHNADMKTKRLEITRKVKEFLGVDQIKLSVDYVQNSKKFFKILTMDKGDNPIGRDLFLRPSRVHAEMWDPAGPGFKTIHDIKDITLTIPIDIDLLDKKNYIPICEKNYFVTIKETNQRAITYPKIKLTNSSIEAGIDLDAKEFVPSVTNIQAQLMKTNDHDGDRICKLLYLKNSGDWGEMTNAKENKLLIASDDMLATYYGFLTNTTTLTTMNRGTRYITLIHRGNIGVSWDEMKKQLTEAIEKNYFYLFVNKIVIELGLTNAASQKGKCTITIEYDGSTITSKIIFTTLQPEDCKLTDLKKVSLSKIKCDSSDLVIQDEKKVLKDDGAGVNADVSLKIFEQLNIFRQKEYDEKKKSFLTKHEGDHLYDVYIYTKFFDLNYVSIINSKEAKEYSEQLEKFVINYVTEYVKDNIIDLYLSDPECLPVKHNYIRKTYTTIAPYKDEQSLDWEVIQKQTIKDDNYDQNIIEKADKQKADLEKVEQEIAKLNEDLTAITNEPVKESKTPKKDLEKIQKLEDIGKDIKKLELIKNKLKKTDIHIDTGLYKLWNTTKTSYLYNLELFQYKLPQEEANFETISISSLLTHGLWDLFEINPFTYSLLYKYLKLNPKQITNNIKYANKIEIYDKTISRVLNGIKNKLQESNSDELKKIKTDIEAYFFPDTPKEEKYPIDCNIDTLRKICPYEIRLFYYLYGLIPDIPKKIIYSGNRSSGVVGSIGVSVNIRDNDILKGVLNKTFFEILDNITITDINTRITEELNKQGMDKSPILLFLEKFVKDKKEQKPLTTPQDEILHYVSRLITKDLVECYSTVINIIKQVLVTLQENDIYLDPYKNRKSSAKLLVESVSPYLEEYDSILKIVKANEYNKTYCEITTRLLEKIRDSIPNEEHPLQYIRFFLQEVLKKNKCIQELSDTKHAQNDMSEPIIKLYDKIAKLEEEAKAAVEAKEAKAAAEAEEIKKAAEAEAEAQEKKPESYLAALGKKSQTSNEQLKLKNEQLKLKKEQLEKKIKELLA